MTYMQIESMIKNESYGSIRCIWYCNPKFYFAIGFIPFSNDQDVLTFIEDVKGFNAINIYVEHNVDIHEITDDEVEQINVENVNAFVHGVNDQVSLNDVEADVNVHDNRAGVIVDDDQADVNMEGVQAHVNVKDVQADCNMKGVESETSHDYEEAEGDECDLGLDVSVD